MGRIKGAAKNKNMLTWLRRARNHKCFRRSFWLKLVKLALYAFEILYGTLRNIHGNNPLT